MFLEALTVAVANSMAWEMKREQLPSGLCYVAECQLVTRNEEGQLRAKTRLIVSPNRALIGSSNLEEGRSNIEALFSAWGNSQNPQVLPAALEILPGTVGPLRFVGWTESRTRLVTVDAQNSLYVYEV
jgi:hypothetical protein